jgi:hypothetical protein
VRARYRQERRAILCDIILRDLKRQAMDEYIASQVIKLVKEQDRTAVLEDIAEDIKELDQSRVVGLGVTQDQLQNWLNNLKG